LPDAANEDKLLHIFVAIQRTNLSSYLASFSIFCGNIQISSVKSSLRKTINPLNRSGLPSLSINLSIYSSDLKHFLSIDFREIQFSDFTDISSIPAQVPRASSSSTASSISTSESEQVIYDQITIQSPPSVFAAYGSLADNNPLTFKEVMSRSDYKLWWKVMIDEIEVVQNKTRELMSLSFDKKTIPLKWIYKIKRDAKDIFEKYKMRIVVRDFFSSRWFRF